MPHEEKEVMNQKDQFLRVWEDQFWPHQKAKWFASTLPLKLSETTGYFQKSS